MRLLRGSALLLTALTGGVLAAPAAHAASVPAPVPLPVVTPVVAGPTTSTPGTNAPLGLAGDEQAIGADRSVAAGADGHGVDVAVIDTGVSPVAGLSGPNKLVYGPDLSTDSQDPSTAYLDGYGHGTAMAGIIGGSDGSSGPFAGVAPGARIVSVKVGAANGTVDVTQVIAALDWVTAHAHTDGLNIRVVNLSFGTDSLQPEEIDPLAHAAEAAWRAGVVVVAAVGNEGPSTGRVTDPAYDPYLLAVGADDPAGTVSAADDVVADFSNVGLARHADLVAPGAYVVSLRVPGSTLDRAYPGARIGDRFFRGSGTSHATAVTSGAVADLLSANPSLTPDQVKGRLVATATPLASASANAQGAGLLQLPAAEAAKGPNTPQTWVPATGLGSVEAARAGVHVQIGGVVVSGEVDVQGAPWTAALASLEDRAMAWAQGTWNGATWSGATWSGATWSGATWSGATWSGATWSGATWSGATWSGATWSGATWSGATWSGATWSGASWS